MSIIRATVSLADNTGLDENRIVNVWHFSDVTGVVTEEAATAVGTFLPTLYQNGVLGAFFSPSLSRDALVHKVTVTQLTTTEQGPDDDVVSKPIGEFNFTISTASSSGQVALPSEVALVLSFRGDIEGIPEETGMTRPASRRRGRVFLGPWNSLGMSIANPELRARPSDSLRTAVLDAYLPMVASLKTVSPAITHAVYSPTLGQAFPIIVASIDDAWDTIRSRGPAPTNRQSVNVP